MVTLSKIIEGLEMVDNIVDCYYNPEKDEIFLSNIGEYEELTEDELDELFEKSIILPTLLNGSSVRTRLSSINPFATM